jgi:CBS domain containing-hemolysin-like protein
MRALIGIGVCIVVAAFFPLAELAIISASRLRLRHWVRETVQEGGWIEEDVMDEPHRLLSPILVGHTLTVTTAAILTASVLSKGIAEERSALFLAAATGLVLVPPLYLLGEVLPRALARARAHRLFPTVAVIMRAGSWLFGPVIKAAEGLTGRLLRMFGTPAERRAAVSRRGLESLLIESERVGIVEPAEREIIAGVFEFGRTPVELVMTPLERMVTAPASARVGEITRIIEDTGYSRIPLHVGTPERIAGMVHVFDLFKLKAQDLPRLRRVVVTNPETPCDELLVEMKGRRCHLAVVTRGGRAIGMVTMEDLVEELVGDIRDEHDARADILEPAPGTFVVDAHRPITEINQKLGTDLPADGAETIAGFLIARLGRIPRTGEIFGYRGWTIEILDATPQRIRRLRFSERTRTADDPSRGASP